MNEKILITGASGFVGSWLVAEAFSRGLDVYAGIRSNSSRAYLQDARIKFCNLQYDDAAGLDAILAKEQFSYIIHNAGITRSQNNSEYFKVNSEYTVALAKSAMRSIQNLKKFVFTSSLEAYGSADPTPDGYLTESSTPQPRTQYGRSKLRAEKAIKLIEGLPYIILRPTAVFGPREKDLFNIFKTIKKYRIAPVVGSDKIKYTFVYIKDVTRIFLDATLSDINRRSYFVSDGKIHNINDFTGAISMALNQKHTTFTIPYYAIDIATTLSGIWDKVTGSKSLLNSEQVAKMKAKNWDADISPLVADFNYAGQYTLQEAINETVAWYQENLWL